MLYPGTAELLQDSRFSGLPADDNSEDIMGEWTLFSNHGHVLVCLAKNNEARLRDVAAAVGITERAVQNILRELQDTGMVSVSKHGRCNHYQINLRKSLRHPLEAHCTVGKLLQLLKITDAEDAPATGKAVKAETIAAKTHKTPAATEQGPKVAIAAAAETQVDKSRPEPAPVAGAKDKTPLAEAAQEMPKSEPKVQSQAEAKADTQRKPKARSEDETPPNTQQGSLF